MKTTNKNNVLESKNRVQELVNSLKGKKVTILGHDNIDVDAAISGILMSQLLDFLKIENEFCIIEDVKENDTYTIIKNLLKIDIKKWKRTEESEDRNLFLVDHYETVHKGKVIGCIDHHPTQQSKDYSFMYVRNSCATAYLIYEIMKEVNFPIWKEQIEMIVVAMMVDTVAFRSSKAIKEEVEHAKKLSKEYKLNYDFLERECLCLTPIEELSSYEIISNGQKWYDYNGNKVGSSYLQLYGMPQAGTLQQWLNELKDKRKETSSNMLVFIIFETKSNITYEYQITENCIKEITHTGILSRGKNIMPLIEARYLHQMNSEEKLEIFVKKLIKDGKTIATMESCTGGQVASDITNIEGASSVLKESYVSYCNEAKIKFGVPKEVISQYTVYSAETAIAMANAVKNNAKSDIGIGITGQLGRIDPKNKGCTNNTAWYCITQNDKNFVSKLYIEENLTRFEKKKIIITEIVEDLYNN